jgi:hypothetical protein
MKDFELDLGTPEARKSTNYRRSLQFFVATLCCYISFPLLLLSHFYLQYGYRSRGPGFDSRRYQIF